MKKHLTLRDVNSKGWRITITDTGYEISNEAGTAQYDVWGGRTTVNGVPEYFPCIISVNDDTGRKYAGDHSMTIKVNTEADLSELKQMEALLTSISRLQGEVTDNFTRMSLMSQEALIDITRPGSAL